MKYLYLFLAFCGLVSFTHSTYFKSSLKKQLAYIPSGNVIIGNETKTVQAFYMTKTEVTNKEYRTFLSDLKKNNKLEEYKMALPDTANWNENSAGKLQTYADYYFSHPAYANFPVVNISHEAANLYCAWFTAKANEGKTNFEIFRLPTQEEFLRACQGENKVASYAWGTNEPRNKKGQILANFKVEGNSAPAGNLGENTDIIAPSKSYWPNANGIYNLNGNVAEMIQQKGIAVGGSWMQDFSDIQNESTFNYSKSDISVGFRMVSTYLKK